MEKVRKHRISTYAGSTVCNQTSKHVVAAAPRQRAIGMQDIRSLTGGLHAAVVPAAERRVQQKLSCSKQDLAQARLH
jgi:hypothetical protein